MHCPRAKLQAELVAALAGHSHTAMAGLAALGAQMLRQRAINAGDTKTYKPHTRQHTCNTGGALLNSTKVGALEEQIAHDRVSPCS